MNLEKIIREVLTEGISNIVYHFTQPYNLPSILKDNNFHASINIGSNADFDTSKGKFYFFSTTRSKTKRYYNRDAKIVLDGRKLANKYKGFPIDYWQYSKNPKDYNDKSGYNQALLSSEEEDRIVLDKPYIDNAKSYIKEIHILIHKEIRDDIINSIENYKDNIPVYYYINEKAYLTERKDKAIDPFSYNLIKNIETEKSNIFVDRFPYGIWRLAALMSYNDDQMKDKIINILSDGNDEEILNKIDEQIKNDKYNYYNEFKYDFDRGKLEFKRVIESVIHNLRTSRDKRVYNIFTLLTNYMKKNNVKTLNDYLHFKLKGSFKYLNDYRPDLLNDLYKIVDESLKSNIDQYNSYRYEIEYDIYNNVFNELPELVKFLERITNKIKEYIKNIVLNKEIEFKYLSGQISKEYINDFINFNEINFDKPLDKIFNQDVKISEDLEDDLKRIIQNIISDLDYDSYNLVKKYINKHEEQFNIKESINESLDNNDIYEYTEISDGKYDFKTEKGTKYVVNLMKHKNGILFNYSADGSYDYIVNEGNMYKVLRTVFTAIKEYTDKNNWIKFIGYLPVRKGNEDIKSNVRHKLYIRFLKQFYNISEDDIKIKEAALKGDYYVFVRIKK